MITKDDLQLNFERFKAKQILRIVKLQIKNKHLFSNQITIRYEKFVDEFDSQLKMIGNAFNIVPNLEDAKKILTRPSYSSRSNKYNIGSLVDKKAIGMIKQACDLWSYNYNFDEKIKHSNYH